MSQTDLADYLKVKRATFSRHVREGRQTGGQGIPSQRNQLTFSGLFAGDGSFSFPTKGPPLPPEEWSKNRSQ